MRFATVKTTNRFKSFRNREESADLLGVNYFSVYRLIQRGKLRACRALRGKLLVPRTELLRMLKR